jgi:hypothetical protein
MGLHGRGCFVAIRGCDAGGRCVLWLRRLVWLGGVLCAKWLGMLENGDGGVARMEGAWQWWLWGWQQLKGFVSRGSGRLGNGVAR